MMNTWYNNASNMANLLAEDTGAYELRNPLNNGMRAFHKNRSTTHLQSVLKSLFTILLGR